MLSNIRIDGAVLVKDPDMLEALNYHYALLEQALPKIPSKPDDNFFKHVFSVSSKLSLNTIITKCDLDAICRLQNVKALGPDTGVINLVKDAAKFIAMQSHHVYIQFHKSE